MVQCTFDEAVMLCGLADGQIAKMCNVEEKTVRRWRAGQLKAPRLAWLAMGTVYQQMFEAAQAVYEHVGPDGIHADEADMIDAESYVDGLPPAVGRRASALATLMIFADVLPSDPVQ